jgi:hypothetical protein
MKTEVNDIFVKDRYTQKKYMMDFSTFQKVKEIVTFYNDSIYNLPDDLMVELRISPDCEDCETVKINHLVFLN